MRGARAATIVALAAVAALASCARDTSPLTAELDSRLQTEGIVLRGPNLVFRHSHGAGTVESRWEERRASIVVTAQTVLIHDGDRTLLELTPRTRRAIQVRRDQGRIRIRAGEGRNADAWSFAPPDSLGAWVEAIRAVAAQSR
ncbi:MAG TPA: hypothetical protein VF363_06345 [Candidatus Eisenbacteria bacterium]